MDTTQPLRVGFLGYRFMGAAHANALARLPMFFPDVPAVERSVLVGRDEPALAAAADRLGFAHTSTEWRDALDDVDVFYVLGPNHLHAEPAIAALEAGVPVLCEKPLGRTLTEAERMAAAAAEATVPAACGFNYRFVPAIQHAKRLVDTGELGEIRHVRARYLQDWLVDPDAPWSWRCDADRAGSGALGDLGAHSIDLVRYLVGDRVGGIAQLSGQLRTFVDDRPAREGDERRPVTVDDAYSAQVTFDGGALGTFEASRAATGHTNDHTVEIDGSDGSVRFSLERLNELEVLTGDGRGYETVLVTDDTDPYGDHWWPPGHVLGWEHPVVHENAAFLAAVGGAEPAAAAPSALPDFEDGLATQRVLDAIERSDERGERVTV